jgi:hypothetical protein
MTFSNQQAAQPVDVAKLRRMLERATPGEWKYRDNLWQGTWAIDGLAGFDGNGSVLLDSLHDAALIVAARNALPGLLDELEALRARIRAVEELCDVYDTMPGRRSTAIRIRVCLTSPPQTHADEVKPE